MRAEQLKLSIGNIAVKLIHFGEDMDNLIAFCLHFSPLLLIKLRTQNNKKKDFFF